MLLRARLTAGGSIGPVADVTAGIGPIVAPAPEGAMFLFKKKEDGS
jgi:hypothetical protein